MAFFTNDFELNQCASPANPFLVSWEQTNSVENVVSTCTGSITNITLSGGTPPYSFLLTYPDGTVSADTTNFTNLCVGTYTATTIDSLLSASTSFITILPLTAGTLTAGVIEDSCIYNINQFCKIEVSAFTHTQDTFTYLLYKDGNLHQSYNGSTGQENHIFTNLTHGNYTLTAYDGISPSYKSEKTELCNCLNGFTLDDKQSFGYVGNFNYTGLTAGNIIQDWRRYNVFNNIAISFTVNQGPHLLPPFSSNPASIIFESGINEDGSIDTQDPYVWFYTGSTGSRKTENTVDWYLGEYNLTMEDGDNVGPPGYLGSAANVGVFYYNTVIEKFVLAISVVDAFQRADAWATINANKNRGQNLLPISTSIITGNTTYQTNNVSPPVNEVGYTVTGSSMSVVAWEDLVGTSQSAVVLDSNASQEPILVSTCKYLNYTHTFSMGSTNGDNDTVGVILAAFIDEDGIYSPKGTPHNISIGFNNATTTGNNVGVFYNSLDNTAYSFRDPNRRVVDCGIDTPLGCYSSGGVSPITGYTVNILGNNITESPFSLGAWAGQGTTYIRIQRSGILGEKFNIKMTDAITSADVGTVKNYNSLYEIDFNILDKSTWVGSSPQFDAAKLPFTKEEDLYKFLGSQSIGYFQGSQPDSYFYNIGFTGTQSNYLFTTSNFGGSQTEQFALGNPDFQGIQTSTDKTTDFYNSIGSGGQVGNPTVPTVRPVPTVTMQTTQIPIMTTTGGTKISASTESYVIYTPPTTEENKEEPCVEFNFTWTKNTTDLLNGNMVPYYSLHEFSPQERAFKKTPTMTRIFDNPQGRKLIETKNNQVIGEGLEASDCIKLSEIGGGSEFLIKPNYVFKDKLKNLESNPCNCIGESLTGMTTGITKTEKWYDTFDPNPDLKIVGDEDNTGIFSWETDGEINTREYGLYDSTTDFYFLRTPGSQQVNLETNDILYFGNNSCGKLATKQIEVSPASGTTGTTLNPIVISGTPYVVTLDFPSPGPLQVTLNGLTLFASKEEDLSDGGDYYFDGNSQVKFRVDTVEGNDVINIIYVPGTFERSYYYDSYIVPETIPNTSGGTSVTGNTLYTNGYYYYFRTTYDPVGDLGITLNGTVLFQGSDFELISNNTIQFTGIQYPDGLTQNDIIGQFYFTKFNLLGTSGVKYPKINATVPVSEFYTLDILLVVRDSIGTIVYTERQICEPNSTPTTLTNIDSEGLTTNGIVKTFTVQVPAPGNYSYSMVTTTIYRLINGDTISDTSVSETYNFSISAAVFYDESNDTIINTTTTGGY